MIARLILRASTALALVPIAPALAQTSTTQDAAQPAEAVAADTAQEPTQHQGGEIIVTARRRNETLQEVPLAVSVIGTEQLEATGSYNVGRLTQLQPSLQFYSTNPRNTSLNIRGLGAPFGLTNDGIEQGVGLYIDQVYNARVAASSFDFPDIERIEVLRGPQGTLYGKNTTAGAVNIVSRRPDLNDWEGRAELTYGTLDFIQARASVSGPIVDDVLGIRLSSSFTHRRGTLYNVVTGHDQNEQDNRGIRGQLYWRPSDTLSVLLSADYSFQSPECCGQVYVRTGATQRPLNRQYAALAAAFNYRPPSFNAFDRLTDLDVLPTAEQEIGGASLLVEWQVGPGTLTSVSAWRFWTWEPSNDRDFIGLPITTQSANPSQQDQFSQELRYAATIGDVDFVLGAFYFQQRIDTQGLQVQGPAASRYLLNPTSANALNPAVLNGLTARNTIGYDNSSLAAFGQLTWRITDALRIAPGFRVNYDDKYGTYNSVVTTGAGALLNCSVAAQAASTVTRDQCGVLSPQSFVADFSDVNFAYDVTLSYDIAPDVLAYATYAHTFKSGGINQTSLPTDANNQPILSAATVRPEDVDHFEIGLKTQWFNRRLTLNLTGFWTEIADFQTQVFNGQLGVLRGYLANAEGVRVRGFELELQARPTNRLSFYFNGTFNDAEYTSFPDAPCPPELSGGTTVTGSQTPSPAGTPGGLSPANCNISGQRLAGVSRWSATYGIDYVVPTRALGQEAEAYFGFDGSARTSFSSNPTPSAYTNVEGYSLANFRVGLRAANGRWDVQAWIRNAFNEEYFELLSLQSGNTGLVIGQLGDPRTGGVTFRTRF